VEQCCLDTWITLCGSSLLYCDLPFQYELQFEERFLLQVARLLCFFLQPIPKDFLHHEYLLLSEMILFDLDVNSFELSKSSLEGIPLYSSYLKAALDLFAAVRVDACVLISFG
jgi:hypothetical protein